MIFAFALRHTWSPTASPTVWIECQLRTPACQTSQLPVLISLSSSLSLTNCTEIYMCL